MYVILVRLFSQDRRLASRTRGFTNSEFLDAVCLRMPLLKSPPTLQTSCLDVVCRLPQEEWSRPHIATWLPKITSEKQPHNLCADLYQDLLDHLVKTEQLQAWHLEHVAHQSLKSLRLESSLNSKVLDVDTVQLIAMRCPNLEDVSLFSCKELPVQSIQLITGNLAHLRVLDIDYTKADDATMKTLSRGCPEVEELRIRSTNVTDIGLFELCGLGESGEGCKKLARLWMHDLAKVTLFGVSYVIRALKELRSVFTEHNIGLVVYGIYQECLLHNLPLLPLKLDYINFTSEIARQSPGEKVFTLAPASYIKGLMLCPNLRDLVLNVGMLADMDEEILLGLSQLTHVVVADSNPELDDGSFHRDVVPFLSKVGAKMERVMLVDFSDVDILLVVDRCPMVKSLVFSNVQGIAAQPYWQVKDSALQNIESFHLDILEDNVPQESLRYQLERVLKNAPKLKSLRLEYVHCFTDDFMSDVMKCNKFEFLETLDLIECHGITRKTIEALMYSNTAENCSEVVVSKCDNLSKTDLDYLGELAAVENINFSVVDEFDEEYDANNNNGEEQQEAELDISID
ncbi:uncharacterized protein LOC118429057 isoform X2 [Branchiostoma floridae]|uniref:Uncharacterized protein LOC118429057 isoform X2 n=1 Tax=Branchiostoma floridae TaxID=7739 RepID=A0A9J7N957_BRAFL|nr:uncharacterized protein LOC118429057 isoform X2 [Branchiostoma floridae]